MKSLLSASAALLLLTASSQALATEELVKDDFESQKAGDQLDKLDNWKFFAGWIKPEYGKIVVEGKNKYLQMKGDIFTKTPTTLQDVLTYKFKIRASGEEKEVGGLTLRSGDGRTGRYDILFAFGNGGVSLMKSTDTRVELAKAAGIKAGDFHEVVVKVEKLSNSVKFTVTVDGDKLIEAEDTQPPAFLDEPFSSGFFTYNMTTIDLDSVEFTSGT